ncbi:hypothetical protein GIB67_014001 [Kingdonia uniflora]|uniref:non-specific serine/threonine protein kinase n=1 Tax=Kingdonia uniflora TaxID=39325 RepID=A0A7J7L5M8_9MAGN|nr:hypothetical protein GIB67_014001 [Kingdonia uniflora]
MSVCKFAKREMATILQILSFYSFVISISLADTAIVSRLRSEKEALLSLSENINLPSWVKSSWNSSDSTPCGWAGIECDRRHSAISLNLSRYGLSGQLGPGIRLFRFLQKIDLSGNSLSGVIPSEITNCTRLKHLDFSVNYFTGKLPKDLKNLVHLRTFIVEHNSLNGVIPESLFMIPNLEFVNLGLNKFIGSIPPSLGNCTKLKEVYLNDNNLVGEIPSGLGNCSGLTAFQASSNSLFGELSWGITELLHLRKLSLYNNQFSGEIPPTLGVNASLENLDFTSNKFSGEIPRNLCSGKQLKVLHLGKNLLQGRIPLDLGNCPMLKRLDLKQNNLTGLLPEFTNTQSLIFIDISGNNINGTFPLSLGFCTNLTSVNLSKNKVNGSIPQQLGNLAELQVLNLSNNLLQGLIPSEISKCTKLYSLDLGYNALVGSIPLSMRILTELSTLILRENRFTGGIPDFLSSYKMLLELQLGSNLLRGSIPSSLGELKNLAYALNLSGNQLTGKIPPELGKLSMLQSLDISFNNLTGSLKPLDGLQSLIEVNVSYNSLNGSLPESFTKFLNSPTSFLGNPDLCVPYEVGGDLANLRTCDHEVFTLKAINRVKIVMIALGSSLLGVISLLGCTYMFVWWRRHEQEVDFLSKKELIFSLKNIMNVTEGLNEKFIIGRGAYGTVYKALLHPNHPYAVKKLDFTGRRGANISMHCEIRIAGQLRHRNLVKLESFWVQKEYGLIVYEYMPNGSLHDVLHEISPAPFLEWDVRYKIALGTAEGLAYLHEDCVPAVVHQDIKPKNILLDNDMEPHISDFGIAKLMDQTRASIRTITVLGTVGYIAPEIAYTMMKNKVTDVYSYGVVLLELITRKKVAVLSSPEYMHIVKWVHSAWNSTGALNDIVDPSLVNEFEFRNPSAKKEILEVLMIALQCTEKVPTKRFTMMQVVTELHGVRRNTKWVDVQARKHRWHMIKKIKAPLNVRLFLWKLYRMKLPTLDILALAYPKTLDTTCSLCNNHPESHCHLFFECQYSRRIWFASHLSIRTYTLPLPDLVATLDILLYTSPYDAPHQKALHTVIVTNVLWEIWQARNTSRFKLIPVTTSITSNRPSSSQMQAKDEEVAKDVHQHQSGYLSTVMGIMTKMKILKKKEQWISTRKMMKTPIITV